MKRKIYSWQSMLFVIVVIKNIITAIGGFICIHNNFCFWGCLLCCIAFVELCAYLIWYFVYIKIEDDNDNYLFFDDVEK